MSQVFFSVVMASSKARIRETVGVPVERGTGRVSQPRVAGSTLVVVETKKEIREFLTSRRAADHARAGRAADLRRVAAFPGCAARRSPSWPA